MAESVLQAATACTKTPATLIDAYEAGRMTRPELLDHLLEWRKAAPGEPVKPVRLHNIQDHLLEVGGIVGALRLMYQGLDDDDDRFAFHIVVDNLGDRIDAIKGMVNGESDHA